MLSNNSDSIFKKRLIIAKDNSKKVKLMFQYPGSPRAVKKSGSVLDIADDGFTIEEVIDGESTYSYNFLVEVSNDDESERSDKVGQGQNNNKGGTNYGGQQFKRSTNINTY